MSEQEFLQEFPVVLSASRLSQPLSEAPNAVTVIDREMIRASGFRTIADLFRLVPGMYVGYENGHTPIVAYHGSTDKYSRRMQVLVDGRSIYLPPLSMVNWTDLPLHIADIDRIEVVRGPAAASYGANSLQGVINIITRDAAHAQNPGFSITRGNGGVSDASAHIGRSSADLDFRATLAYRADDGFDTQVLNDSHSTRLANLRAGWHPGSADSVDFQFGYSEGVRGLGIVGRVTDPFTDVTSSSNFQQITWLHALPQFDELKLNYYHVRRSSTDLSASTSQSMNVHRHELELQHTAHLGAGNRLVWGGGARSDTADAPSILAGTRSLRQSRLFAHDEWRMTESALLNLGAMLEDDGMGHRDTSPRASVNYHLSPQHTLRVGTSVAYRSPAMAEEYANIPGQYLALGGLRPERVHSREIGYLGDFRAIGATLDMKAYYDRVSDIIYTDPAPLAPPAFDGKPYSLTNLLSATYRGLEGTMKYKWSDAGNLTVNYSRQYASCTATGTIREPAFLPVLQEIIDTCPSMVPRNSGSILLAQQLTGGLQLSAGYYHQAKMQFINTFAPLTMLRRLDLRASKTFGKPGQSGSGEVALVVQNALRDEHTEFADVPHTTGQIIFNRRAFLTATLNL